MSFLSSSCTSNHRHEHIVFDAIGKYQTEFSLKTGAPRQGILLPESKGVIVLDEIYAEALSELNNFEYIWVISYFDKSKGWESLVNPPESEHEFGLFATRSPRRPNAIGLSLIKLDSVTENKLYVSGVDMFNNTPVLDIKPYLPSVDKVESVKNMFAEIALGHHDEEFIADSLVKEFVLGEKDKAPK